MLPKHVYAFHVRAPKYFDSLLLARKQGHAEITATGVLISLSILAYWH